MMKEDDEVNNLEKFSDLFELSISPQCMRHLLIKDKFNDHILIYFEDITSFSCYLCDELGKSPCYECSFCQIHLHKECANLPFKIKHNLHEHPLFIQGGEFLKRFICDGCQVYHERDICYRCEECSFSLDRMCAQGIPSTGNHYQKFNDNGSKVGFSHFSHNHKLRFAFIPEKLEVHCSACRLLISGPTYCCYACYFFLHELCFDELKPQYIQHPFHIRHPLHFKVRGVICKVCRNYSDIGYECANVILGLIKNVSST
ncbi:hypothetical protein K2173_012682 [Erythroxylum novogranatense]|uniref:DC1 domain-containing protein n=1 Tax=Erythroxylum novogranatense TaxID=1862640 RepID=A0AAV8TJN6_9ROSI|nr:hypothetical protein K2173_012682 [Erythroxylum novogranatense]